MSLVPDAALNPPPARRSRQTNGPRRLLRPYPLLPPLSTHARGPRARPSCRSTASWAERIGAITIIAAITVAYGLTLVETLVGGRYPNQGLFRGRRSCKDQPRPEACRSCRMTCLDHATRPMPGTSGGPRTATRETSLPSGGRHISRSGQYSTLHGEATVRAIGSAPIAGADPRASALRRGRHFI